MVWTPIKSCAESVTPLLSTCLCICLTRSSTPMEEAVPLVGMVQEVAGNTPGTAEEAGED